MDIVAKTKSKLELPDDKNTVFNRWRHIIDIESEDGYTSFNLIVNDTETKIGTNMSKIETLTVLKILEQQEIQVDLLITLDNQGYTLTEMHKLDHEDIRFIDAGRGGEEEAKRDYFEEYLADYYDNYETFEYYLDDDFYRDMTTDYTFMESEIDKGFWVMDY